MVNINRMQLTAAEAWGEGFEPPTDGKRFQCFDREGRTVPGTIGDVTVRNHRNEYRRAAYCRVGNRIAVDWDRADALLIAIDRFKNAAAL